jgi:hypothetical protein
MLIYEKKDDGVRKLFGTLGTAPSDSDNEVTVEPEDFDFKGPYYYKAPGGIKDAEGNELTVSIEGTQIIPPVNVSAGEVNEDYDTVEELVDVDDNDTPDDTSDDVETLAKVWTEEELEAETKATIAEMAKLLGYEGIDVSMSKSAMIEAFLDAQEDDPRNV